MNRGFMEQMRAIIPSLAEGPSGSFESYVEDSLLTPSALAAEAAERRRLSSSRKLIDARISIILMDYMTRLSIHYIILHFKNYNKVFANRATLFANSVREQTSSEHVRDHKGYSSIPTNTVRKHDYDW